VARVQYMEEVLLAAEALLHKHAGAAEGELITLGIQRLIDKTAQPPNTPQSEITPAAYRHEITEPDGRMQSCRYTASADNPWSHWTEQYRERCNYRCTPLYLHPADKERAVALAVDDLTNTAG
jgi:hypothetical protein